MSNLKAYLSGILIGLLLVAIGFSTLNSFFLISDKEKEWSSATAYLPEIKIPERLANSIVTTVEAKLNE